jgi:hypothetical protein
MALVGQVMVVMGVLGAIFWVIIEGVAAITDAANPELHSADLIGLVACPSITLLLIVAPGAYLISRGRKA